MRAFVMHRETSDPSMASRDPWRVRDLVLNSYPFYPSSSTHPHEEDSLIRRAITKTEAVIQQRMLWQLSG